MGGREFTFTVSEFKECRSGVEVFTINVCLSGLSKVR